MILDNEPEERLDDEDWAIHGRVLARDFLTRSCDLLLGNIIASTQNEDLNKKKNNVPRPAHAGKRCAAKNFVCTLLQKATRIVRRRQ